jgi:metal-responsive CopG/Arc/MetJ family transcriptional regulator
MRPKKGSVKRILVCIPVELLKSIDALSNKYKNRSAMIREALELLIVSHKKKRIERELKEGFRILKNLNLEFADRALSLAKEIEKN